MNVLFLQDYNFLSGQGGGAELSDGLIFAYGMELGHNIILATPNNTVNNPEDYDLVVISNATLWNESVLLDIMKRSKKVLYYAHDYWDHCKWRLYKNNRENCRTFCPRLPFGKKFFEHVDGVVFLSPKHRESYLFVMPELESKPFINMPSPIDITEFDENIHPELKDVKRVPNTVIASNVLPFKGSKEFLKYSRNHKKYKFTVIGAEPDQDIDFPSNVEYVGRIDHKDMPRLLRSFQFSILLPGTVAPFERFPVEALLSGCNPIVNDNVGCTSYEWFGDIEKTKKEVFNSPKTFWSFAGLL